MTLKQMDFFIAAYEAENLNRAARVVYLSPQAVSRNIQRMEEELGLTLFIRTSRGVKPTSCADYLYQEAKKIQGQMETLHKNLAQMRKQKKEILVGIGFSILPFLGITLFRDYEKETEEIRIQAEGWADLLLEEKLEQEIFQMILTIGPLNEEKFAVWPLKRDVMCAGIPQGHTFYKKEEIRPSDLNGQAVICCSHQFRTYHEWEKYARKKEIMCRECIGLSDFQAQREMVERLAAILIAPEHLLREHYPDMRRVPLSGFDWQVVLATKRGRKLPPEAEDLIRYIQVAAGARIFLRASEEVSGNT